MPSSGTCALDPVQYLRMERPATAPASIDDIDAIFQKLNSAMSTTNQLLESALTPTPEETERQGRIAPASARASLPQRAASVSVASSWNGTPFGSGNDADTADWAAYERKLRKSYVEQGETPASAALSSAATPVVAQQQSADTAGRDSASQPHVVRHRPHTTQPWPPPTAANGAAAKAGRRL